MIILARILLIKYSSDTHKCHKNEKEKPIEVITPEDEEPVEGEEQTEILDN